MKTDCRVQLACKHDVEKRESTCEGSGLGAGDLLRASMMPPENTRAKMDSTPTVEAMIGSRPTAAQPLNRALDAMLVRNSTSQ